MNPYRIRPLPLATIELNAVDAFESIFLVKGMVDIIIPCHDPSFTKVKSIP